MADGAGSVVIVIFFELISLIPLDKKARNITRWRGHPFTSGSDVLALLVRRTFGRHLPLEERMGGTEGLRRIGRFGDQSSNFSI
jgi:hypothetical protein